MTRVKERKNKQKDTAETRKKRDPDLANVEIALIRAGQRARERARQAGIGVIVFEDGKIIEEQPDKTD